MKPTAQAPDLVVVDRTSSIPKWVWIPAVAMVLVGFAYSYISLAIYRACVATMGQFGEMFGVLTSLVSILGFAGVLWSLHLQREQLKASLADMKDNAAASRELAAAANAQAEALAKQNEITLTHTGIVRIQSDIERLSAQLKSADARQDRLVNMKAASGMNPGVLNLMLSPEYRETDAEINRLVMTLSQTVKWLCESAPE